jgi:hypothetical protein
MEREAEPVLSMAELNEMQAVHEMIRGGGKLTCPSPRSGASEW